MAEENKRTTANAVREALFEAAAAQTNFQPFLNSIAEALAGHKGTAVAIVMNRLKGREPLGCFRGFTAKERASLLAGGRLPRVRNTVFRADICAGAAKAGSLVIRLGRPAVDPKAASGIAGIAAAAVGHRLAEELRDEELNAEKDIAAAVKHIEELYLSFPNISIEEISRAVLDEARRMTGSRLGFAGHMHEPSGGLLVSSFAGGDWMLPGGRPVIVHEFHDLWGRVLKRRRAVLSNDAAPLCRHLPEGHGRVERFLGVPAMSGRKLLGMLALANPERDYGGAELETAQKLARVYAMILQRKLAEDKRREEDERFRAIISSSKDVIFTADLSGRLTYMSPRAADYGYTPEEMLGRHITDFAHPDDKDFIIKAYAMALKTGRTLPILPYRVRRKDGTFFYAEQKSGMVMAAGKPAYVTGVMRDVDEQHRTEARLKENERLMRMVFDTAKDSIFIKDMNGLYVKVNATCAEWMGVKPEDMIGRGDSDYFPKETAEYIFKTDSEVVRTGRTMSLNNNYVFPTGQKHINIVKTPLRSLDGGVIGILGIARDISDIKRMETELALTRAAEAVSQVARPMAHDFNNALAAINGYATLIDDGLAADSPIKNEISQIIKAVQRAAELTSRFQAFARNPKIEGGEKN